MGSKEWPPCTPSQENKSTQEGQRKVKKYTKRDQEKPNQKPMEVVELISTRERQREQLQQTRNQSRSRTQPNNGLIKVQHTRDPIQQEQGSESTKNPQLDLAKPTARSNKTNSRVGQQ